MKGVTYRVSDKLSARAVLSIAVDEDGEYRNVRRMPHGDKCTS